MSVRNKIYTTLFALWVIILFACAIFGQSEEWIKWMLFLGVFVMGVLLIFEAWRS